MENFIVKVIVLGMIWIYVSGMIPAVATNDPAKIQEAADKTSEKLLDYTTDRVIDEVEGLPLKIITEELLK
jgi:hypothetical protein